MTDRQFLIRMIALTEKLCDVYNVEPLDQESRLSVLDEIHEAGARFNRSRRHRSCFVTVSICVLICLFALIVFTILF